MVIGPSCGDTIFATVRCSTHQINSTLWRLAFVHNDHPRSAVPATNNSRKQICDIRSFWAASTDFSIPFALTRSVEKVVLDYPREVSRAQFTDRFPFAIHDFVRLKLAEHSTIVQNFYYVGPVPPV